MQPYSLLKPFAICALALAAPSVALAQSVPDNGTSIIQDTGVANRLVAGELLRAATQGIPAAACHLHNGIDPEDASAVLEVEIAQLDELFGALLHGDIFWGIEASETRRKTILEIETLQADWSPVADAARTLLTDPADVPAVAVIYGAADALLDKTDRLLTTLDAQYSSSAEILKRDVMFIQISGRMAALGQRAVLQSCLLASKGMDPEIAEDMRQSITVYQNSLRALVDGLPALGIMPPPTSGIADKLAEIELVWSANRPALEAILAGEVLTQEQRATLYNDTIDEAVVVLDLLYLFQDHSKVH